VAVAGRWQVGGEEAFLLVGNIASYLEFELESGGTRVPLSLARSSGAVCARLSSSHCVFVALARLVQVRPLPGWSEVKVVDPEEDLRNR
jgi:hypothetical protein